MGINRNGHVVENKVMGYQVSNVMRNVLTEPNGVSIKPEAQWLIDHVIYGLKYFKY